jgi:hypothetical protein
MIHVDVFLGDTATVRCRLLDGDHSALSVDTRDGVVALFGTWQQLKALADKMAFAVDAAARSGAVAARFAAGDSADPPLADPCRLVEGVPSSTIPVEDRR